MKLLNSVVVIVLLASPAPLNYLSSSAQTPAPAPSPSPQAKFSVSDLEKLRWIEGTWRGTGDVEAPFFERYKFENPSTLAVDSFTDASLTKVEETTKFELKD